MVEATEQQTEAAPAGEAETSKEGGKNERSAIVFPYNDLNFAVPVAQTIHAQAGQSCAPDQLAAWMGQNTRSGAFAARLSAARIFGLIETERGVVRLTDIGRRIVAPASEPAARADAFLAVPLYRAIYDRYRGYTLPPAAALEREMAALGVSSRQTDKARQAFERSADQAGFFAAGRDRLVMPGLPQQPETKPLEEKPPGEKPGGSGSGGGDGLDRFDPFIQGLIQRLPEPSETKWPMKDRVKWLQTAANVFDLIYEDEPQGGSIEIHLKGTFEANA